MEIKHLTENNFLDITKLYHKMFKFIENPDWYMAQSDQEILHSLQNEKNNFIGAYNEENVLMGISCLIIDDQNTKNILELANVDTKEFIEFGGTIVLPEYQGDNLMYKLNSYLLNICKEKGYGFVCATAHPENTASCKSLAMLGMHNTASIVVGGRYKRNLYTLTVKP